MFIRWVWNRTFSDPNGRRFLLHPIVFHFLGVHNSSCSALFWQPKSWMDICPVGVGGPWLRTECFICGAGTGQEEKWTTSQAVVAQGKDSGNPGLRHRVVFGMLRWSPKRKARCFENGICYAFAQVVIEAPSKYVLFHFFCG